ncbi:MAG TPA: EMC3/TMCO1 family protein, partial [Nitrososphaerales archaeon]|nr:EMC3/TMCO1 family protein [Nitrososphaerales archaeon]
SNCNFWVPQDAAAGSHTVKVMAGTDNLTATFNVPGYAPPYSTVVVTLTSLGLGFVTQMVTRTVVDLDKERKMRAEVNAFNKEKREATLAKDQVKLDKLKKRELAMRQEQAKVSTARLKVTGITFVPLLVVYYLMATFLGGYGVIVAFTPIPIPVLAAPTLIAGTYEVSLFWWYFLSSFTFSTMLSRLLHTTT